MYSIVFSDEQRNYIRGGYHHRDGAEIIGEGHAFVIQFNSILPNDLKETVETYARAVESGMMSVRITVESLDVVEDVDGEMELIGKQMKENGGTDGE